MKRNGKDRQKCGLGCSEMGPDATQLEARRPDCRQTSDFSKTESALNAEGVWTPSYAEAEGPR